MNESIKILEVGKSRFIIGSLLAMFTSFTYYSFLYVFRELLRYFTITEDHDLLVLSDSQVLFCNLFIAYVAIIIGISTAISFFIDRPLTLKRKGIIRSGILNDQRVLNLVFLAWATKLGFCFGLFFGSYNSLYNINFITDYSFLFVLIIIVLFLQLWPTLFRFFKLPYLRLLVGSFTAISILAFILSSVNIIDYKAINHSILKNNIYYAYDLERPESVYWEKDFPKFSNMQLYYVYSKLQSRPSEPNLIYENEICPIDKLDSLLMKKRKYIPSNQMYSFRCVLNIDKSIKMRYVDKLKTNLSANHVSNISYSVLANANISQGVFMPKYYSIKARLPIAGLELIPFSDEVLISIIYVDDKLYLNECLISVSELGIFLKDILLETPDYLIEYSYENETIYGDFIYHQGIILKSIKKLRDDFSLLKYNVLYDHLDNSSQKVIRRKFPISIVNSKLP